MTKKNITSFAKKLKPNSANKAFMARYYAKDAKQLPEHIAPDKTVVSSKPVNSCIFNISVMDFLGMLETNKDYESYAADLLPFAADLLPNVTRFFDFNFIIHTARFRSPKFYLAFAKLDICKAIINTEEKFLAIANINPLMALALTNHAEIYTIASKLLPSLGLDIVAHNYSFTKPAAQRMHMAAKSVQALDLGLPPSFPSKKPLLDPELDSYTRYLTGNFFSTKEYIEQMMYGENGYYNVGRVNFNTDFKTSATDPTISKVFSASIAYQLFATWEEMISNGILKPADTFNVLECGSGNGDLCYNILEIINTMARLDSQWKHFNDCIRYFIVERASALIERQKLRLSSYKTKVQILHCDARFLKQALNETKMAAVFSNELLDMFSPHKLCLTNRGLIQVGMVVPTITEAHYALYFRDFLLSQGYTFPEIKNQSNKHKAVLREIYPQILIANDHLVLDKTLFNKLHDLYSRQNLTGSIFTFLEYYVDSDFFPEVTMYLKNNPQFTELMNENEAQFAIMGIDTFIQNVQSVLTEQGIILTVDYGAAENSKTTSIRTFNPRNVFNHCDIFKDPGQIDITVDVRFGDLVRAGNQCGLSMVFFGNQPQLLPMRPIFPPTVISEMELTALHSGTSGAARYLDYKVCLQMKSPALSTEQKSASIQKRFHGSSQPLFGFTFFKQKIENSEEIIKNIYIKNLSNTDRLKLIAYFFPNGKLPPDIAGNLLLLVVNYLVVLFTEQSPQSIPAPTFQLLS